LNVNASIEISKTAGGTRRRHFFLGGGSVTIRQGAGEIALASTSRLCRSRKLTSADVRGCRRTAVAFVAAASAAEK